MNTTPDLKNSFPPAHAERRMTTLDWYSWLSKQEKTSFEEYRVRPERLVSDFNGETQFTLDYVGRELLELLQNANDAALKANTSGRTHIELLPSGLIAANRGAPFSPAGVASLCLPHTSPKPSEGTRMIGNKGLGFRSVLNWTRYPLILSGDLSIAFSDRVAHQKQAELEVISEELRDCIVRQKSLYGDLVVPLLAFPGFDLDGDITKFLEADQNAVYLRSRNLQEEGYDTVIGMPFDRQSAHTDARKQLELLRPEVLLFARGVSELEITVEGEPSKYWRRVEVEETRSRVYLDKTGEDFREWTLYCRRDYVPRQYLSPDHGLSEIEYELVLAIPESDNAVARHLYSYFPTEVQFPYPVVGHATLDLQANRQQPQDTPANHFIVGQLADFMSTTAEELARQVTSESGLSLIAGNSSIADGLEKFGFRKLLLNAAKTKKLVPTLGKGLVIPANARNTEFSDTSWLPTNAFPSVVRLTENGAVRKVLLDLDVPVLNASDWLNASPLLTFPTLDARADFIAGIVIHRVTDAFALPGLLLDGEGDPVPKGTKVFLPAVSQETHSLPSWFEICFLHPELRLALTTRLKPNENEGLASMLSPMGVARYSLDSVIGALVAKANGRVHEQPKQTESVRRELLQALWKLFPSGESREDRPRFPRDALVLVLTKAATYADARKVYLSAEYGNSGRILEDLYRSCAPEKLVAAPGTLRLEGGADSLAEFFVWLGAAERPRYATAIVLDRAFLEFVKAGLPEPCAMEDYVCHRLEEITYLTHRDIMSIDELDNILSKAPPGAILAWLATDNRAVEWKSPSVSHGAVGCYPPRAHNARYWSGLIPSYVRWKLKTTKWLPTRNNQIAAPQETLAEVVQGVDKLLPVPARVPPEESQRYGLQPAQLRDAFDRAGVLPSFSQIDPQQLYELLLSLPRLNPKGDVAKSIYLAVLKHFESSDVRDSTPRERFVRTGSIWARMAAGEGYCPVTLVRHVDSEDIPSVLSQKLNIAALPKRSGNQKVEALFGVRAIERSEIIRRISSYRAIPDALLIEDEVENLKPLFIALRRSQRQSARETVEFKQLRVTVCSSIEGKVEFQGQEESFQLGIWDWIMDDQSKTAYVLADPAEVEPLTSDLLADAVGQIFAAVFRVERGDDFARLFRCNRKDRLKMLRRLVGDDDVPEIEELIRRYSDISPNEDQDINIPRDAFAKTAEPTDNAVKPPVQSEPIIGPTPGLNDDQPLEIDQIPHTPSRPSARVECRVTRKMPSEPRSLVGSRRVTDGTFCEFKVMEFEKNDSPPRFPLRVANITGWKSPRVDVLSFVSAEDKARFQRGDHREALVARFIEVKGRSSEGATIDLRDNSLKAARTYKDRYFLYRVFDQRDGNYEIAILRNPIADATGAQAFYEINLGAATGTEEFHVAGGISEGSYQRQLSDMEVEGA